MEKAPMPKPRALGRFSGRADLGQLASEGLQGMVLAELEENADLIDAARALLEQPDHFVEHLRALAEERGITMTDIVREALARYLETAPPPTKPNAMFEAKDDVDCDK
jgi:hypothetical protein